MTLACPKCRRFYRVKKVGVYWEEGMPATNDLKGPWQSYKLWAGDLLECEGCGSQVISGPPMNGPVGEHYQPDYPRKVELLMPIVRIDDCPGSFNQERADELRVQPSDITVLREALDRAVARAEMMARIARTFSASLDAIVCVENDTRSDLGLSTIELS